MMNNNWPTLQGPFDGSRRVTFDGVPEFQLKWKIKQPKPLNACLYGNGYVVARKSGNSFRVISQENGREVLELKGKHLDIGAIAAQKLIYSIGNSLSDPGIHLLDLKTLKLCVPPSDKKWISINGELNAEMLVGLGCLRDSRSFNIIRDIPINRGRFSGDLVCGYGRDNLYDVICFDVVNSQELWRTKDGSYEDPWIVAAISRDFIVLHAFRSSRFLLVDARTGKSMWEKPLLVSCQTFSGFSAVPAVDIDRIVFACCDGSVRNSIRCLDIQSGTEKWLRQATCLSLPIVLGNYVAATEVINDSLDCEIRIRSMESGDVVWRYSVSRDGYLLGSANSNLVVFSNGHIEFLSSV